MESLVFELQFGYAIFKHCYLLGWAHNLLSGKLKSGHNAKCFPADSAA
jgi:hypothetical protein